MMLVLGMVTGGTAVAQEDIETVEDSAFETLTRPVVYFYHDEHNDNVGLDCYECHHVYNDDGELVDDETSEDFECSECHTSDDSRNLDLVVKYHERCKGCHEQEEMGPILCSECHMR
jgi:hypothetical protein